MLSTVVASGRVMSFAQVKLGALSAGTVVVASAREGQSVKAGDVLLRIDDTGPRAREAQAIARLAEARAGWRTVRGREEPSATQQLQQAEARRAAEQRTLTRALGLANKQALAPSDVELAQTNLRLAQSQVAAAEAQLAAVTNGGSESLRAKAAIDLAEAQLAQARVELAQTQVRAPCDGVILEALAEQGDSVSSGAPLFVLAANGAARVVIEPDERTLATIALGQKGRVSTEAFPDDNFDAIVAYVAPAVNARRGTIEVRLDVPNGPHYLRPDMTVSVEILVRSERQAIVVPASVIQDRLRDPWVLAVRNNRVERRGVRLGADDSEFVQVVAGLAPGELIVQAPTSALAPGQRVRVDESDSR